MEKPHHLSTVRIHHNCLANKREELDLYLFAPLKYLYSIIKIIEAYKTAYQCEIGYQIGTQKIWDIQVPNHHTQNPKFNGNTNKLSYTSRQVQISK